MPKMKSNRGASKSFKKTASGASKERKLTRATFLLLKPQKEKEV